MNYIDIKELERILAIKDRYEKGLIDIDMINPKDYAIINTLYKFEINKDNYEIEELKKQINELYKKMEEMIEEAENSN